MALTKTPEEVFRGSPPSDAYQPETADAQVLAEEMIADSAQLGDDVAFASVAVGAATGSAIGTNMNGDLQVAHAASGNATAVVSAAGANANGPRLQFGKSRGATALAYDTPVQSSDSLGTVEWYGCDGDEAIRAAYIRGVVDGTVANGIVPAKLVLHAMDAAGALSARLEIGSVIIECFVPIQLQAYNVASLPSASAAGAGAMIYCTGETGGAVPAFSDGTDWRRVTDRAVVS